MSTPSFTRLDAQLVGVATLGDEVTVQRLLAQGADPALTCARVHEGTVVKVPLGLFLMMAKFDPVNEDRDLGVYESIGRLLIERTRLLQPSAFVLASVFEQKRGVGEPAQVVRFVDPQTPEVTQEVAIADKRLFEALFRLVPRAYQEEVRAEQRPEVVMETPPTPAGPVIVDELALRRAARRRAP